MGKAPGVDALYESDPFRTGAVHALIAFFLYALRAGHGAWIPRWTSIENCRNGSFDSSGARGAADRVRRVARAGAGTFVQVVRILAVSECAHDGQHMLLMSGSSGSEEASTFLLTNAVTCFYIPLVFFICLIGRHVHYQTTLVYAVVYGGSLLCMAVGRIIVYAVGPTLDHSLWLLIVMAIVVLVEATLIMRPRFMGDYPIGFELGTMRNEASEGPPRSGSSILLRHSQGCTA